MASKSKTIFFVGVSLLLQSCATVQYVWQASLGQLELFNRARPIDDVLKDPQVSDSLKASLLEVEKAKKFSEEEVGLLPTGNYTKYVDLKRDSVVWVVSACKKTKFDPETWWFPLVGSFTYLGWFSEELANRHAEELKKKGLDVYVRGASAYSTLGWFHDPIISTMIPGTADAVGFLVNTVIHESVHATLYIPHQSTFNESLANFVADEMTPVYLEKMKGRESAEYRYYEKYYSKEAKSKNEIRKNILRSTFDKLKVLYDNDGLTEADKLVEREKIFQSTMANLKSEGYLRETELNNAYLIQFATYETGDADFHKLYESCGRNWPRFFKKLGSLTSSSFQKDQQEKIGDVITKLVADGC